MQARAKKVMLLLLAACFFAQTYLVYTDAPSAVQHGEVGRRGARLWHGQGCQACHQLYGFGGFLGPDLTNAASSLGSGFDARLASVLSTGPGQMPAYDLDVSEVLALATFLRDLDRSGRGQAHASAGTAGSQGTTGPEGAGFEGAVEARLTAAQDVPAAVRRGFSAYQRRPCRACHRDFQDVPGGAPDLSRAATRLDAEALAVVLEVGRAPGMPAPEPPFDAAERADVAAFLTWVARERGALSTGASVASASRLDFGLLPWWEFDHAP